MNQPYLFPYLAYWQLINISDLFVIADNMQYIKRGYINRNNMLANKHNVRFTLEVLGVHQKSPIDTLYVGRNRQKILKGFFYAYKRAPHFEEVYPLLEEIILNDEQNLAKYVSNSIEKIVEYLDIKTKIIYLSELQGETSLKGQERAIDICKRLNVNQYINAIGGQELYNKDDFLKEGIQLNFLKMDEIQYKQFDNPFVSHLSIIDVMMFNSKDEVKKMLNKFDLI